MASVGWKGKMVARVAVKNVQSDHTSQAAR